MSMDEPGYTLVVIDLHPMGTAQGKLIEQVRLEVRLARQERNPIIFLWTLDMSPIEDRPGDPIYAEILHELCDYDGNLWEQVGNITEDSSCHILYTCRE